MPVTWTKDGGGEANFGGPHSFWRKKLPPHAPLDPNSIVISQRLADKTFGHGSITAFVAKDWTQGIFIAQEGCPRYSFTFDRPDGVIGSSMLDAFSDVPVPDEARPAGPWPGPGDNHMFIYEPSTDQCWDMWQARQFEIDGPHPNSGQSLGAPALNAPGWHLAFGGAMEHTSQTIGYWDNTAWHGEGQGWGATATKLLRAAGLITTQEGLDARDGVPGAIPHAIGFGCPNNRAYPHYRWPAQTTDGGGPDIYDAEEGSIFRFPHDIDLDALVGGPAGGTIPDPFAFAVCEAIRDYGMVLLDNSGSVSIYCESKSYVPGSQSNMNVDVWLGTNNDYNNPLGHADSVFKDYSWYYSPTRGVPSWIPWNQLQLLDASYRPTSPIKSRLIIGTP